MVRTRAVVLLLILLAAFAPTARAATCTGASLASGSCSVGGGTTGGGVDLWGDVTSGGDASSGSTSDPTECPHPVGDRCLGTSPPKDSSDPTTVHDIASFRPDTPAQVSEPRGWTLRAVPTNFVAVSSRHVVSGELLGVPADVRFTPVRYSRDFGDGIVTSTSHAGGTWAELGQPWWTRTATSHTFAEPGFFTVRLTVWFEAEYRFGNQSWHPLAGWVLARANNLRLDILSADTVLVHRICADLAIGCSPAN